MPGIANGRGSRSDGDSDVDERRRIRPLCKRGDGSFEGTEDGEVDQGPLLTDDDSISGSDDVKHLKMKNLKMKMKLSWHERETVDLELEKGRLFHENRLLKAEQDSLRASYHSSNPESDKLKVKLTTLGDQVKEKELELAMVKWSLKDTEDAERHKQELSAEVDHLRTENARLQKEAQSFKNKIGTLELKHDAAKAQNLEEALGDLRVKYDIVKAQSFEDALNTLKKEYDAIKVQNTSHSDQVLALTTKHERIVPDVTDVKSTNSDLQVESESLRSRIDILSGDKNSLKTMNSNLESTIKVLRSQIGDDTELKQARRETTFYKSKMENLEIDLKEIEKELTSAVADRDWHKQEHVQMLTERNARNAERAQDVAGAARVRSDKGKLKKQIRELREDVSTLKWNIGWYISELDLAEAGFRVFTCRHKKFENIPDGYNSTREKSAGLVASEFFGDWKVDEEFIREYMAARGAFLKHHRAHERANQGRGAHSSNILHECQYAVCFEFSLLTKCSPDY
jgi:chromosome segregation ATPase